MFIFVKMKNSYFLFLSLIFFVVSGFCSHKYYVSTTQIDYVEEKTELQITIRLFTDDLEDLLQTRYDAQIRLNPDNKPQVIEQYLGRYLKSKLNIKVDGKSLPIQFLGIVHQDDQTICYAQITDLNPFSKLYVQNQLFFDLFESQQNFVHFKNKDVRKSFLFVKDNDNAAFNL